MAKKVTIPERILPMIALLGEHADKLSMLKEVIESLEPGKQTPALIAAGFASKASLPLVQARDIVTQLMAFQDLRMNVLMPPADVFDAITESLENVASRDWKTAHLEKWKSARDSIEKVLEPSFPLCAISKSIRLSYEHQNILYTATIVTDVRPAFDDSARDVQRMTIAHMLELDYSDGRQRCKFFAALDAND